MKTAKPLPVGEPIFWTGRQAAAALGIDPRTLYQWRIEGRIPEECYTPGEGKAIRYRAAKLRAWAAGQ